LLNQTRRGAFLAELHRGVLDKRHSLERAETIIGRDVGAHIRVDDGSVSREHAAIQRRGERYIICDLGSRNGTTVNEQHLRAGAERELQVNDCIFLGKAVLCFLIAEDKVKIPTETNLDALTGIPDEIGFSRKLGQAMSAARAEHRPLGLFLVGIDDLAGINERFGKGAGDVVIRHVARVLGAVLEPNESLARYRGAVFGLIAPDLLDGLVLDRAQALRARVEDQPVPHGDELILVSVSVGATPMMALDQEKILEAADAALSRAKQRGSSVERASRTPDAQTERYKRRLVPQTLFAQWLHPPAVGFAVRLVGVTPARSRQTPVDFELQAAVQQNLSGDELATYPDGGGWVVVTVPSADEARVPRLCEAIRSSFDQALASRKAAPVELRFGAATTIKSAADAVALAER
jgi:diguanylate cyclase (GGDEF)-like protein